MRRARIKRKQDGAYYHMYNRVIGCPGDFPFGDVERERLVGLIQALAMFYTIEPIDFVIMGNHFHLVAYAPGKPLSLKQAARRYNAFYPKRLPLSPEMPECLHQAKRLRDISAFMKDLQQGDRKSCV